MKNLKLTLGGLASFLIGSLLLSGCATSFNPTLTGTGPLVGAALHGKLMGGQQPILGARIYLLAAGSGGYGSASSSLLGTGATPVTNSDSTGSYVTTSLTDGSFNISGTYICPSQNAQVYLLSESGNAGAGVNNDAAILMVALGNCGDLSSSTFITMNELTTVAAVTALQQFATGPAAIGTSSGNALGLQNAFTVAKILVNINNGVPLPSSSVISYPEAKIYTLGDAMAGCVNTTGAGSTGCQAYFAGAANPSTGVAPTDTFHAMLNIAQYPAANPAGVIAAVPPTSSYGHALTSAHDFSLPLVYTGPGLTPGQGSATSVAIDANGNAWVSVCGLSCDASTQQNDAVIEITPYTGSYGTGYVASGSTGFGTGSVHFIQALALDQSNYVYTVNATHTTGAAPYYATPSISVFAPSGVQFPSSPITSASFLQPEGLAFDTSFAAWVTDPANGSTNSSGNGGVYVVSATGTVSFPLANISNTATALKAPTGIAMDSNNHIIVTDAGVPGSTAGGVAIFAPSGGINYSEIYSQVGAVNPTGVAVDSVHRIWELDSTANKLYKLTAAGGSVSPALSTTGVSLSSSGGTTRNFIIDGSSQPVVPVCIATCGGSSSSPDALLFLDSNGNPIAGRSGLQDSSLQFPTGVAIDGSGNTWVSNSGSGVVTEFVGMSAPVITPLSQALTGGMIATKP